MSSGATATLANPNTALAALSGDAPAISDATVERFSALFSGRTDAYGRLSIDKGRFETYAALQQPLTQAQYRQHLEGVYGLGVYVVRPDATASMLVFDIDEDSLTAAVSIRSNLREHGIASYIEPSKRKGFHVWTFWRSTAAAHLRQVGKVVLERANVKAKTEIFPKQDRADAGGLGNFINLPYFPAESARRIVLGDDLQPLSLEAFLAAAVVNDPALLTDIVPEPLPSSFIALTSVNRRSTPYDGDDPPCIEAALNTPADKGTRHNVGVRLSGYFQHMKGCDEEETLDLLAPWNDSADKPLTPGELRACVQGVKYSPSCTFLRQEDVFNDACVWEACHFYRKEPDPVIDIPAAPAREPFPVDVLPQTMRRLVEEGARSIGCPPDFIAVPLIVYAAAAIGKTHSIRAKSDWIERPNLYAAIAGPPGSGKSPAMKVARCGIGKRQDKEALQFSDSLQAHKAELAAWQGRPKEDRGLAPAEPSFPSLYTTSVTTEKLATMVESARHGVVMECDELASWVSSCDMYRNGRGSDRDIWLSLWAGSDIKIDRKGSLTVFAQHPAVCVIGGIQPDRLANLRDRDGKQDGFTDRILYSEPAGQKAPGWTDEVIDEATTQGVIDLFEALYERPASIVGLSPDALEILRTWVNDNAARINSASAALGGYFSKLPAHLLRLALVLHVAKFPERLDDDRVDSTTMANAVRLVEYFRNHAEGVLRRFAQQPIGVERTANRILPLIQEAPDATLSQTEISNGLGRNVKKADIDPALERLESSGRIVRMTPTSGGTGWPATRWRVSDAA